MFRRLSRVSYRPQVMLGDSVFKTTQVLANLDALRRACKWTSEDSVHVGDVLVSVYFSDLLT